MTTKHKTVISYHHANDEQYKIAFQKLFADIPDIIVPWVVEIDPNLKTETIRRKIRDEYLRDSTVTVVLIDSQTWQRKHVDWEISSSIRDAKKNKQAGVVGILLPSYPLISDNKYNPHTIRPRLYDNVKCGEATLHKWSNNPVDIRNLIHGAYEQRNKINPDNSYPLFSQNRTGNQWQ